MLDEIDAEIASIESQGGKVTRFSMVGYSLGGLIARYTLGLLQTRRFFDDVAAPVNFATFASPALGVPSYTSIWKRISRFLGMRVLSRSGDQLYMNDRFLPTPLFREQRSSPSGSSTPTSDTSSSPSKAYTWWNSNGGGGAQPHKKSKRGEAEPLLKVMADPRYSFHRAIQRFERVEIFANSLCDRTVPYPTGAIEAHDPFALARVRAEKAMRARGHDPDDHELDLRDGGLEM